MEESQSDVSSRLESSASSTSSSTDSEKEPTQSEREIAKYELERLHREKMEVELKRTREELRRHTESSKEKTQRRRRENIYVLFALGIIGGFFTLYPNFNVNTTFDYFAAFFVSVSFVFLFLKIHTIGVSDFQSEGAVNKIDYFADYLFLLSITGIIFVGPSIVLLDALDINLDIGSEVRASTLMLVISIIFALKAVETIQEGDSNKEASTGVPDDFSQDLFALSDQKQGEEGITMNEFIDKLEEYKAQGGSPENLEDIPAKIDTIRMSEDKREKAKSEVEKVKEELKRREKSQEELREEERKQYRETVRGNK